MMDCLILGDSIAAGVSFYRPECVSIVKKGISSKKWNVAYMNRPSFDMMEYNSAIISLGSNDDAYTESYEMLEEIRGTVKAKTVFWVMPAVNKYAQDAIFKLARYHNDKIIYMKEVSKDGIHPTEYSYKWIAFETK
jgi:hypothetical protein